ncbi:AAA family ATPase [Peptoniphilus lacrimalis]|uniref:AAA family ATPase n=1 Tax=Peptoniphilus lacrimalis TaxID=33031 RepID=UPI0025509311|nr:AAA family ATPase [Peptoniphilus lacrimalis]MDK7721715.1 AAA family ATPase [Peptoniphilus lacrimalis]MDK7731317.1 AAA family ATPase [Peptoniphilus lacrimalis]
MLLESIKLENFRQFRNEYIEFAQGADGKNVTIIIGDNGTGKTTFAQAFFWCLYGETEFSDKNMINKLVASDMKPGQKEKVQVTLKLTHGNVSYTLMREQVYSKDYSNRIKGDNTIFDIAIKDSKGNTTYVKKTLCEGEVNSILPKELSKYFFFDGERIEKMSKDISTGKKATDFAEAVKGLLGLNAMFSAIQHFNPRAKNSVIGSYESSYSANSNIKIIEYTKTIGSCKEKIAEIDSRIDELENQIEQANSRKAEKVEEIKLYAEGEELQLQKEKLLGQIKSVKTSRSTVIKEISKDFNANMSFFFSSSLMLKALEFLANKDFIGKDIPFMHSKTIEYLLKQKVCICGTHLDEGSVPYNKIKGLLEFLPPKSLSTNVSDFKKESNRRANARENLYDDIKEKMAIISKQDEEIVNLNDDLNAIEKKLSGNDVRNTVRTINAEIQICDQTIRKNQTERDQLLMKKGGFEKDATRADTERRNLTLLDENNKKIEIYKAYAEKIHEELQEVYVSSETEIRSKLELTINEIFRTIYEGGLSLTIDEKYHISVYADDYDGDVETSTAQSISVIFAFITGIIKMARENRTANNEDAQLLSSEPYPLVMDAPLSTFDKRRIKTVCESLPNIAEQVIIFIKDTDGELAEDYMGDKIGSRHQFDKKNEFETVLL